MAKFFVLKSGKMDFLPTEQNNFFKNQRKPMSTRVGVQESILSDPFETLGCCCKSCGGSITKDRES